MSRFAEYFELKDSAREDFRLSPERDYLIYVELDPVLGELKKNLEQKAPKAVLEGDFGTGKSHVLRHVQHCLSKPSFEAVYIELSGFGRRSDFYDVHRHLMTQLLPFIEETLRDVNKRKEALLRTAAFDPDTHKVLSVLASPRITADQQLNDARSWLKGGHSAASARRAGYTGRLFDFYGPSQLVSLYRKLGDLYREMTDKTLLLLVDEGESFTRVVDEDAQVHIGSGLRSFFDADNTSIGFILGLNTPGARGGTHPMLRSDVRSRVGSRYFKLLPLNTPERVRDFLDKLWQQMTQRASSQPFLLRRDAQDLVAGQLEALRRRNTSEKLASSPTPRDLLDVLSVIGRSAVDEEALTPIGADLLRRWFALHED